MRRHQGQIWQGSRTVRCAGGRQEPGALRNGHPSATFVGRMRLEVEHGLVVSSLPSVVLSRAAADDKSKVPAAAGQDGQRIGAANKGPCAAFLRRRSVCSTEQQNRKQIEPARKPAAGKIACPTISLLRSSRASTKTGPTRASTADRLAVDTPGGNHD